MRKVDRGNRPPPVSLMSKDKNGLTELDRARAHQASTKVPKDSFEYLAYKHQEVKQRLEEIFHGKCAYCETYFAASAPVDVEHFRPKGAVGEDKEHPGYWWLAMVWTNLLPSCIDCNRKRLQRSPAPSSSLIDLNQQASSSGFVAAASGKKDSFPLAEGGVRLVDESIDYDSEKALLLDPTRDDPAEHLCFHVKSSLALVAPAMRDGMASERGAMSIQVYGLNRLGLVQDRTRLLRRLEFLGELVIDLGLLIQDFENPAALEPLRQAGLAHAGPTLRLMQDAMLHEMREMSACDAPYSAMASAWLEQFVERLKIAEG